MAVKTQGKVFVIVDLCAACCGILVIVAMLQYYDSYLSFGGFAALAMILALQPGLFALIVEILLLAMALGKVAKTCAKGAFILQIVCGALHTVLLCVTQGIMVEFVVYTVLMVLGIVGAFLQKSMDFN